MGEKQLGSVKKDKHLRELQTLSDQQKTKMLNSIQMRMILLILALTWAGCATYREMPLEKSAIDKALTPKSMEVVRVQAKEIKHPVLKPVDFDERDGLSPDEAAIMAVLVNPTLTSIRDQRGLAAAQLLQAGILPNPQFSYSLDFPTGGNTQGTVGFSWDVKSLITRGPRVDAARAQAASVDLDVAWKEWQVAEGAKLHVYRLFFLGKQLAVAREEEAGLQNNRNAIKKAVDLGDMTVIDLAAAEAALETAHLSVLTTEHEQEKERLALNQALGLPPERVIPLQQDTEVPSMQSLPSISKIMESIEEKRLDLLALKMGYQSQEALLRAAVRSQFPRINIGFAHARDTSNVVTTGFSIAIEIPFFDRNQGQIAIEKATRKQLFDEYINRLFDARASVANILGDMESIKVQIRATEKTIATLESLVQTYYKALLEGNADVLSYYNARNDLTAKQIEVIKLRRNLTDRYIALEIAAGEYMGQTTDGKVDK